MLRKPKETEEKQKEKSGKNTLLTHCGCLETKESLVYNDKSLSMMKVIGVIVTAEWEK